MEQGTWVTLIPVIVVANKPQQLRSWYTAIGVCVCACGTSAKHFSLTQLPYCNYCNVRAGDEALTGVPLQVPDGLVPVQTA